MAVETEPTGVINRDVQTIQTAPDVVLYRRFYEPKVGIRNLRQYGVDNLNAKGCWKFRGVSLSVRPNHLGMELGEKEARPGDIREGQSRRVSQSLTEPKDSTRIGATLVLGMGLKGVKPFVKLSISFELANMDYAARWYRIATERGSDPFERRGRTSFPSVRGVGTHDEPPNAWSSLS
jgi:hypothetical protein